MQNIICGQRRTSCHMQRTRAPRSTFAWQLKRVVGLMFAPCCLRALEEQSTLYSAARSAKQVLHTLMRRLGVALEEGQVRVPDSTPTASSIAQLSSAFDSSSPQRSDFTRREAQTTLPTSVAANADYDLRQLDIEAVVQSFILEQKMVRQSSFPQQFLSPWGFPVVLVNSASFFGPVSSILNFGLSGESFDRSVPSASVGGIANSGHAEPGRANPYFATL